MGIPEELIVSLQVTSPVEIVQIGIYQLTNIRTKLLGDHLRRQLSEEEAQIEDGHAIVVLVGDHSQIHQHIIGQSLCDVASIQLEGEEH